MNTISKTRIFNSKKMSFIGITKLVRGKKKKKCPNSKGRMNFLLVERKGKKLNTKTALAIFQVHASIPADNSPSIPY